MSQQQQFASHQSTSVRRDKIKEQKAEAERDLENQRKAGGSYAPLEPESFDTYQFARGVPAPHTNLLSTSMIATPPSIGGLSQSEA
ncbi:zinc ion binding protein [Stemphylium lycopersici]|uniref:Zinc ion binding protein n=1 Tax=Stemphylium lycopersici TaxID=183478 RepID=A0A364MW28_STELY|nr:zinc ion binding protein [Stemphylium lycopersici]RAR05860.1 zinc ion binding protein [Stemphylium lycopersici]